MFRMNRRHLLKSGLALGAGASLGVRPRLGRGQGEAEGPRFLVVVGASGGGSIIDAALAVRASECRAPDTVACYPDAAVHDVANSPFRAVEWSGDAVGAIPAPFATDQRGFFAKHASSLVVATVEGTSVNHQVGQRRSITGNEAWAGRTLQECVAAQYGEGYPLPNVLLATGTAFTERGRDASLPSWAFGETVADPRLWPLSLDGRKGIGGLSATALERARRFRNQTLDAESAFFRRRAGDPKLQRWAELRAERAPRLEQAELIDRLLFLEASAEFPLAEHGLEPSPSAERVRAAFPRYDVDPFEAQAALAFLLLKHGVSVTVTLAPSFSATVNNDSGGGLSAEDLVNPPIAFDFSHQSHRATQNVMWARVLGVVDRLVDLLASEPFGAEGESFWDRSLVYIPTEFGRTKTRPAGAADFGSGHDLNNGVMMLSPLIEGGRVLGGVDPDTARTYGWDLADGRPQPGSRVAEAPVFAGILDALGVDTRGSGLPTVTAPRRRARG
jgi:hypothetical protein